MEISQELADRVMRLVVSPEYRPVKPKAIATALKLDEDGYREVRRVVKQLVKEGRLIYATNHLVMSTGSAGGPDDVIRGSFRRARGGDFGFVRPNSSGADESDELVDDIFIPPGKTGGALEGDLVEVRIKASHKGGQEGKIVEIVERARRQFAGTFRIIDGEPCVFLDGTHFDVPVSIGDVRGLPLENDDKVFVEMVDYPDEEDHQGDQTTAGTAVLLERLGSSKNPAIDTKVIMRQYGLPDDFPEDVVHNARQQADKFVDGEVPQDREDLTDLITITIDPFDARDFDDAISLQREKDRWRLWVHIADVAHFVEVGSALDVEARARATSVYLPDRVIPMIPTIISNHLASLQPNKVRLVKTVEIEMLDDLTITHTEVHNAAIHSDLRLNYEQVDQFLDSPDRFGDKWGKDVCDLLHDMHALAMQMRQARFDGGSLSMDMPEIKLDIDGGGKVKGADRTENTESHQIIEEFMLAANQAVASWLDDLGMNFLHRIHAPPDRRKLRQLTDFVKDLHIGIDHVESRFDIQRVLEKVRGKPLEDAVNFAVLKTMSKAVYGPQAEGHYALDMQHYCHFTSPIRRYPDLTVHRLVDRLIKGEKTPDESFGMLLKLGQHCSDMERNAAQAERDLTELKLLHFLNKHVGDTMKAVVSRVQADGFYARCIKLPVDGFVAVGSLPRDDYRYERRGQMLVGFKDGNRYRLGDLLTVKIARIDLQERQLYLKTIKNHTVGKGRNFDSNKKKPGEGKKRPHHDRKKQKTRRRR